MRTAIIIFTLLSTTLFGFYVPCLVIAADDGAKTYSKSCSPCHSAKIRPLDTTRLTKEQWKESVDRMIDMGAEVPKGNMAELLDYLVLTHGPTGTATGSDKK